MPTNSRQAAKDRQATGGWIVWAIDEDNTPRVLLLLLSLQIHTHSHSGICNSLNKPTTTWWPRRMAEKRDGNLMSRERMSARRKRRGQSRCEEHLLFLSSLAERLPAESGTTHTTHVWRQTVFKFKCAMIFRCHTAEMKWNESKWKWWWLCFVLLWKDEDKKRGCFCLLTTHCLAKQNRDHDLIRLIGSANCPR